MKINEEIIKLAQKKDSDFIFYYDETNNIRKLHLKEDDFLNIPMNDLDKNFMIGGVVLSKEKKVINFEQLIDNLRLDKEIINSLKSFDNKYEIKFKHIGKKGNNNFLQILDLDNISVFLNWLYNEDLYIHYSSVNLLYWTIIDILEFEYDIINQNEHAKLKTVLYLCAKLNLERFVNILKKHNYPNLEKEKRNIFIYDLKRFLQKTKPLFRDTYFNYKHDGIDVKIIDLIVSLLDRNTTNLPFLIDEEKYILIDDMFSFYYTRITSSFNNSIHILDEENTIEKKLEEMKIIDTKMDWERIHFINSKYSILIQVSDILIGLMGKAFQFINTSSFENIINIKQKLNDRQLSNLLLISKILHKSNEKNSLFLKIIDSSTEHKKFWRLFEKTN